MIYKITLKDHKKHKSKLLKLIDNMPNIPLVDNGEKVDKSDWLLLSNFKRDYWHYFADNLLKHFWIDMKNRYFNRKDIGGLRFIDKNPYNVKTDRELLSLKKKVLLMFLLLPGEGNCNPCPVIVNDICSDSS